MPARRAGAPSPEPIATQISVSGTDVDDIAAASLWDDLDTDEEERMVEALRQGDESAFAALVSRYHASLQRLASMYVQDAAAAEEIAQETWLGVLRGVHTFEGRSSLKTWIFRILVNRAKTRAVRGGRAIPFSKLGQTEEASEAALERIEGAASTAAGPWASTPNSWGAAPDDVLVGLEATDSIHEAVESLPPTQRVVLTLRDIEGWTSEDVCALLGISESNQRVLLHRARARVRRSLEGTDV